MPSIERPSPVRERHHPPPVRNGAGFEGLCPVHVQRHITEQNVSRHAIRVRPIFTVDSAQRADAAAGIDLR